MCNLHACDDILGKAGQGRAGQGRAGQGRAGQGRAGQGRADQSVRTHFMLPVQGSRRIRVRIECMLAVTHPWHGLQLCKGC